MGFFLFLFFFSFSYFFYLFYFIFKLYIIVLVLPNIKMNLPQGFFLELERLVGDSVQFSRSVMSDSL